MNKKLCYWFLSPRKNISLTNVWSLTWSADGTVIIQKYTQIHVTFNFCVDHRGRLQRSAHLQGAKSQMMKTWQKVKIVFFFFCTKIFISFIHCIYISIQPSLWKNVTISCRGVCLYFKADSEQCVSFDYSVFFSLAHSHRVVLTGAETTG